MIPTIQILILLLVVIAAVAFVAERLKVPPAILLVLTGVILALFPGLPTVKLAPVRAAADHLFVGGGDELARVPIQSAADFAVGCGLRPVHDCRGRRGDPLVVGFLLARRLLVGSHHFPARRRSATVDRAPHAAAAAARRDTRG